MDEIVRNNLKNSRILITGGSGFVGRNLVATLTSLECEHLTFPDSHELDLTNQSEVFKYFQDHRPQIVIHLAGKVGGIGINRDRLGEFFYQNAMIGILVYEASRLYGVKKLISLAAGCGYPDSIQPPFHEAQFFDGLPDRNSYGYSLAKKNLVVQGWAYRDQYQFDSTVLLPANLYGPHDNFDLYSSHVVPALINKFSRAVSEDAKEVVLWGTGIATREFLFVADAIEAIIRTCNTKLVGPFNIGTGKETSIRELADTLAEITGFKGSIKWDPSMPDGQTRRFYDMTSFSKTFNWMPSTTLRDGLQITYQWFLDKHKL